MIQVPFPVIRYFQDQALLVVLLSITGLVNASLCSVANAGDPDDSPTKFVTVGKTEAIKVLDENFSVTWPAETTGEIHDVTSDPEVLSVVRMEKLNGVTNFYVTGKRIGTVSLVCTYKEEGKKQGFFNCTVYVKQDDDRINKILKSYNTTNGAQLEARSYGTGERVVIEGVAESPAQMSAILAQLPNKHLSREHLVVNVKYKCQCHCCTQDVSGANTP